MTTIELAPTTINWTTTAAPTTTKTAKGWHEDPFEQHEFRYNDGNGWTDHVTHFGPVPCQGCNPYAR